MDGDNNLENLVEILKGKFEVAERDTANIKMEMSKIIALMDSLNNKF